MFTAYLFKIILRNDGNDFKMAAENVVKKGFSSYAAYSRLRPNKFSVLNHQNGFFTL